MSAYVHSGQSDAGPFGWVIAALFVALFVGMFIWMTVNKRRARRQRASDARDYAPILASEAPPAANGWRELSGPEATPGVLIPPFLGGVPDQLPAALQLLHLLAPHIESPRATTVDGAEFRVFGSSRISQEGNRSTEYDTTCADFKIPAACPLLMIFPRLAPNGAVVGEFGSSVLRMESNDFNETYVVICKDRRFAFSFVDGRMMEWLLAAPRLSNLAVQGGDVFVELLRERNAPIDFDGALKFAVGLRKRIPEVVSREWGSSGVSIPPQA